MGVAVGLAVIPTVGVGVRVVVPDGAGVRVGVLAGDVGVAVARTVGDPGTVGVDLGVLRALGVEEGRDVGGAVGTEGDSPSSCF